MLRLARATLAGLISEASKSPDREVCGLVWGSEDIQVVRPLRNVHPDSERYYRVSTSDLRQAFVEMDQQGGEPLVWYHSHPGGKPDPSEEDMAGALDKDMYYLILHPEAVELRAGLVTDWRFTVWECLEPGVLVQATYQIVP